MFLSNKFLSAEFVQVLSRSHLKMRVWECGAGITDIPLIFVKFCRICIVLEHEKSFPSLHYLYMLLKCYTCFGPPKTLLIHNVNNSDVWWFSVRYPFISRHFFHVVDIQNKLYDLDCRSNWCLWDWCLQLLQLFLRAELNVSEKGLCFIFFFRWDNDFSFQNT